MMKWVLKFIDKVMGELYAVYYVVMTAGSSDEQNLLFPPIERVITIISFIFSHPLQNLVRVFIFYLFRYEVSPGLSTFIWIIMLLGVFRLLMKYYLPKHRKIEQQIQNKKLIVKIGYVILFLVFCKYLFDADYFLENVFYELKKAVNI